MRSSRRLVGQTGEQPSPETARGAAVPQQEGNELEALARLAELLPQGPEGEVWFGDDAAVVQVVAPGARAGEGLAGELVAGPAGAGRSGRLLMAADSVVGGVDADLSVTSLADFGWKALAVNLSDIAAMGGGPGARPGERGRARCGPTAGALRGPAGGVTGVRVPSRRG